MGAESSKMKAMKAVEADDVDGLKQYFEKKGGYGNVDRVFELEKPEKVHLTFLEHAVTNQSLHCVQLLLETAQANPNTGMTGGGTVLCCAAQHDSVEIVAALVKAGANIHSSSTGKDELMAAAGEQRMNAEEKAAISHLQSCLNKSQEPPLVIAARKGNIEMVAVMLESYDVDRTQLQKPLAVALEARHTEVIRALLDRGAKVSPVSTELVHSAWEGEEVMVRLLLQGGADPNASMVECETALQRAAAFGHLGVVESLLAAGANPSKFSFWIYSLGWNLDSEWKAAGNAKLVAVLGDAGVPQGQIQSMLQSPLFKEDRIVKEEMPVDDEMLVRILQMVDLSPKAAKWMGESPLHYAATNGRTAVVDRLLCAGADASSLNGPGETPLELARKNGHLDVVSRLNNK